MARIKELHPLVKAKMLLCEKFGFTDLEFDYDHPVWQPSEKRLQIRDDKHYAPRARVNQYAAALANGAVLPPAILTLDGWLVDGNTSEIAAAKAKLPTFHAVIINIKYLEAHEDEKEALWGLGAAANIANGLGIDRAEIRKAINHLSNYTDADATRIAAWLSCPISTVQGYLYQRKSRSRAERLGMHLNGSIKATRLKLLGGVGDRLNDEPYALLVRLVQDTGMPTPELKSIIDRCLEVKSDAAAVDIIHEERKARAQQIAHYTRTGKTKSPIAGQARQHAGFFLKYHATPEMLVEHNPDLVAKHLDMLRKLTRSANSAIQAQERARIS